MLCICNMIHAESRWQLKKEAEGVKVFTQCVEGSNVKAIKVECTLHASLSQLTALLLDAPAHEHWVYSTKKSYLVKKLSPTHLIYYSEMSMPWPMSNRDVVIDLNITQAHDSKTLTVHCNAIDGMVPLDKNMVRVTHSNVTWTVTPVGHDQLNIEYVAQADPGGSVPSWITNMFLTKGPMESFRSLRNSVKDDAYKTASYEFVNN